MGEYKKQPPGKAGRRTGLFLLVLAAGLLTFFVFSHFRPLFPEPFELPLRIAFIVSLLISAFFMRRSPRFTKYWLVSFAFFTAAVAQALDYYFSGWSLRLFGLSVKTPTGIAMDKMESTLIVVLTIFLLTIMSGQSLSSIYLRKGKLPRGLAIGGIIFIAVAAISVPWANWQYQARDLTSAKIVPWMPWILLFVLANGLNEELLVRGLFLGKLEPFLGRFPANLCLAMPFAMMHVGVDYSQNVPLLLALLIPLGLGLGYLFQKTDSIIAPALVHASFDIAVVLSIFSTL